jgi:bisphosphoglycerate-dependent phosphoglycerate mutase
MITVNFVRHGVSIANEHTNYTGKNPSFEQIEYRDPKLSSTGIINLIKKKDHIKKLICNSQLFLVSPLKRTIQTFLVIYNDNNINSTPPVYLCPLVSELNNNIIENFGSELSDMQKDYDIIKLNDNKLNFNEELYSDIEKYFYYYGWKEDEKDIWSNRETRIISENDKRINSFMNLMCELYNKGINNITIFTHYQFIKILTNIVANNHDIIKCKINIISKQIFDARIL